MLTEVTSGVQIIVEPRYEPGLSSPMLEQFLFSYHIEIRNHNDFSVQLMRRHWFIFDSFAVKREVEGPGVIGEFPILAPGASFDYHSACDLRSMRGTMKGFYSMKNMENEETFRVNIPQFKMEVPFSMN